MGFAYTPDHGKTSIRAGYGISYWMAYWSGPLTILGLTYPNYAKQVDLTPNNLTPSLILSRDGIPLANPDYDSSGNLLIPSGALIRGADYNWKQQRVDQASLNVERELRPGMVLDIGYVDVRGLNNNHSTNINQAPPTSPGTNYNLSASSLFRISSAGRCSYLRIDRQQLVRRADDSIRRESQTRN